MPAIIIFMFYKSGGLDMARITQEELLAIFHALKKEVKPYEKGTIKARMDIEGKYDLWSEKPGLVAHGKMRNEVSFVTLIVQSSYVGFYYMPIYTNQEEVKATLAPALLKNLKGKACFHIKKVDKDTIMHIKAALKTGHAIYKKNGWL